MLPHTQVTNGRARIGAGAAAAFFALCAATYVVNAADRVIFPVLLRPLRDEYGFTLAQGGFLATVYLLGLGLGGIGTGYVLDRWSRKGTMIAGIIVYSLFTILTAASLGFADMAAYRVLTGVGEGVQNVALVIAVGAFYTGARTFVIGLIQCALGAGSFLGPLIGAHLLSETGDWRIPFYAFGVAGLVGAVAVLFVSKGFTEQKQAPPGAQAIESDAHIPDGLWNRNVICIMVAVLFRSFPFFAFVALYTTFLTTQLHFPLGTAAGALGLFGLGPFFSPLAGYVADRMNQKSFQIAMLAVMAIAGFLIFNVADTAFEHYALSLIEGTAGGFAYVNGYSLMQRSVKAHLIARASGFYYAAATFPAAVSGYLMAKLVEAFGWTAGATLMMTALLVVPVIVSLFIDTARISGRGRRQSSGRRIWT
jgi:MFS family permease